MEFVFNCPSCNQELSADTSMLGGEIPCPSCREMIIIQENAKTVKMVAEGTGASGMIMKPKRPLDAAAKAAVKFHVKTLRRTDCIIEGKDCFDITSSEFLSGLGDGNLVSATPIQYSIPDPETKQVLNEYGLLIIYKS